MYTEQYNTELWKLHLLFLGDRNSATPDKKKTLKEHPLDVAIKYVEMYSSSNAAAQDPEERVQLINILIINTLQGKLSHKKLQKKKKIE